NGSAPCSNCHSTCAESAKLTATPRMVTQWAPARPTLRPNRPATMAPNSGARAITSRVFIWIIASALQRIEFGDVDGPPAAEQGHQDGQADRRLGGGHGQDEEHEYLAGGDAQEARERHEVDVNRTQNQLHAHQQHDDVLAVDEDAGNGDAEQHRGQREVMSERDHCLPSWPPSAGILTRRMRSSRRTAACRAGSWCLVPGRRRRGSITATT